ncbi:MAG: hypothetical protein L6Q51_05220 [Cyclobacteriaceae bacterium]|nr:hypothetical protein [Cyclobacteriaceae bacterium]
MSLFKKHIIHRQVCLPHAIVLIVVLALASPVLAQNTKGDQPGKASRETRFKTKPKKARNKSTSAKRITPKGKSKATSASQSGKPGKPLRPVYKSTPGKEKARQGNTAGNRVKVRTATGQTRNVYPQRGPYVRTNAKDPQTKWRAVPSSRVTVRSATGRTRNVYPQSGRFVHNPARKPSKVEQPAVSNKRYVARNQRSASLQQPPRSRRVVPASASSAYIARKSINPYAGFWNRKQKGERAYTGDISGRRLRTKNYETPRPKVIKPTTTPYYGRKRIGDRPYKDPAGGRYVTATRESRAWRGDISGRRIRGRNFSSRGKFEAGQPVYPLRIRKDRFGDRPYKGTIPGGGYKSATRSGEKRPGTVPVQGRAPGIGAKGIDTYQGNIKGRKTFDAQGGDFSGFIKARKPLKGGGSVSGKLWNNQQTPVQGRTPGIGAKGIDTYQGNIKGRKTFDAQGGDFTGYIKAKKPLKGGGSVSGKLWNNQQTPVQGRTPGIGAKGIDTYQGNIKGRKTFDTQGADFSGYIKAKKPLKGGGSISGKLWNNREQPIPVRTPQKDFGFFPGKYKQFDLKPSMRDQGEEFAGVYKAKKPKKGGGSVSGTLWNNNEQPIAVRTPDERAARAGRYQGNIKVDKKEPSKEVGGFPGKYRQFDLYPDMRDQGEEFTGYTRLSRFKRNYLKNPNQAEEAIKKSRPDKTTYQVDGLQVRVKRSRYIENKNSDEEALRKLKPSEYNDRVSGLQVRVKEGDYKTKPQAAKGSLPGIAASKTSMKASEFYKVSKLTWDYKHNPSSDKEALNVREPGKAFMRATDYQGNIRMKKFDLFGKKDYHPDAQFVKTNKNNVKEEKDFLTNFKLWWARLFRKNETQPDNLKEKIRKPRFDKREQGLWYD